MSDSNNPPTENSAENQPNPYATPQAQIGPAPGSERTTEWELASRWARLGGALIDGLILLPISIGIWFALGVGTEIFKGEDVGYGPQILASLITAGAFIAINYHFWEKNGQSIGKMVARTKIVRTNGDRCPASRIVTHRYIPLTIAQQIPVAGGFVALADSLLIFRSSKKCLHDDIADTIVIKVAPNPSLPGSPSN